MQEFVKPFNHIKTLRSALKGVSSSELQKFIDKMNIIRQEKVDHEQEEANRRRDEKVKLEQALSGIHEILESSGLDMEDILVASATKRRTPTHVLNVNGKQVFYVGTGRMPKEFEQYLKNGGDLDALKINK